MSRVMLAACVLVIGVAAPGCGSSVHHAAVTTTQSAPAASTATSGGTTTSSASGPAALQAEANAAAAGDIPDNQVFLVFRDRQGGYSMKYPEGWAQQGAGDHVVFRDKNNIVRIVVSRGPALTAVGVRADLGKLHAQVHGALQRLTLAGAPALKAIYTTSSSPNAVTGKRVKLIVDRYYLGSAHRRAVVDLGTPVGVDNVDAYRLMIESFRWR